MRRVFLLVGVLLQCSVAFPRQHAAPLPLPALAVRGGEAATATRRRRGGAADGLKNGLASALAAAVAKTALQPFDTLKTVQQASVARLSVTDAFRVVLARGGVGGLYAGLAVSVIGATPSIALYFSVYQASKRTFTERMPDTKVRCERTLPPPPRPNLSSGPREHPISPAFEFRAHETAALKSGREAP